ncbi:hypothetical protein PhaeoP83_01648 [Phaeobacter inhibens]|uniref:Uncharacterized protein n=1 Tax=Phaeobacter inhibens TaxID=221822 RepID=A0ABM6RDL5_9RHOB|nr:hypothetical protein PhaeoP83_01648 [Phaeobacter inhibens]AUQ94477.1 hypothetical protein PhaeoP66_01695 [Phaeobacter inhibens]AUR19727.1 hypothetical protein PhaeoP80_01648 [Phaeobacter inhibens]
MLVADAYKVAASVDRDRTVSHRVFGDSKKLSALRSGAGIDVRRFNNALRWFLDNWPEGHEAPKNLCEHVKAVTHDTAA